MGPWGLAEPVSMLVCTNPIPDLGCLRAGADFCFDFGMIDNGNLPVALCPMNVGDCGKFEELLELSKLGPAECL